MATFSLQAESVSTNPELRRAYFKAACALDDVASELECVESLLQLCAASDAADDAARQAFSAIRQLVKSTRDTAERHGANFAALKSEA